MEIGFTENNSTILGRCSYYVVEKSEPLSELASMLKVTLTCYPNRLYHWIFQPDGLKKILNKSLFSTGPNDDAHQSLSQWIFLDIQMKMPFGCLDFYKLAHQQLLLCKE